MDSRLRTLLLLAAAGLLAYFVFFRKSEGPAPAQEVAVAMPPPEERGNPEQLITIRSGGLQAKVSTYSGAIYDMYLTEGQFRDPRHGWPTRLATTSTTSNYREQAYPLRSDVVFERDGRNVLPHYLTFTPVRQSATEVELVAQPPGTDVEVRRTIRAHTEYAFRVRTQVINHGAPGRLRYSDGVYQWVTRREESGGFFRQPWQRSEGMCNYGNNQLYREAREELAKRGVNNDAVGRDARFVATGNLYFLYALVPQGNAPAACHLRAEDRGRDASGEPTGSLLFAHLSYAPVELASGQSQDYGVISYFGPKHTPSLVAAAPPLGQAVNLGFFAIIARVLLRYLQLLFSLVRNWGVAIILLTVTVRIALYPLLARSIKSMAMMQRLKPQLDEINKKFADNQEQRGLATMELYRKNNVNVFGGCLPQLAQLPIWWALYTTLQTSVELFHAPFALWWRDLSAPDPFYVLPLVLGATMFLQQKLMPPSMPDPVQQKMMLYFMPIFLTGISLFLPAGLALYMLVNSVLAIVQQRITKAQIDRFTASIPPIDDDGSGIQVRPAPVPSLASGGASTTNNGAKGGGRRGGRR